MTSDVKVPYSEGGLLNFAPVEVVKKSQPIFADHKNGKCAFVSETGDKRS